MEVYPRGCGGTRLGRLVNLGEHGLSPRVRGNRGGYAPHNALVGSIPAGAGEPAWLNMHGDYDEVYPRGCGGTAGSTL